jgi:SAM-dependent methyltransferase
MAASRKCPLCNRDNIAILDTLSIAYLAAAYRRVVGIDVERLFEGHNHLKYLECSDCHLRFFEPLVPGNSSFYQALAAKIPSAYYRKAKEEFRIAARYVRKGDRVLEVGCGRGFFAAACSSCPYQGLEMNEQAAREARESGLDVSTDSIQEHSRKHPESSDIVCAFQVLEHVEDPASFVQACLTSLKNGGRLILSTPSEESFMRNAGDCMNAPPHHLTRWCDQAFKSMQDLFGLHLLALEHEPLQPIHRVFYLRSLLTTGLRHLLGRRNELIHQRIPDRVLSRVAKLLQYPFRLVPNTELPFGHTVVAIFEKSA